MLKDRVYGITQTLFHDPYYQRHVVGAPLMRGERGGRDRGRGELRRVPHRRTSRRTVFNVGRYLDRVVRTPAGLKFARSSRSFDSELIPNSIIYPI